jgi:N6-adenosine-specific RNA methylase IME4
VGAGSGGAPVLVGGWVVAVDVPAVKYRTIVADPPWPQEPTGPRTHSDNGGWANGSHDGHSSVVPYETLTVEEIARLPVADYVDKAAHLYLWTFGRFVEDAYDIARLWGFRPSALLTWCKAPMGLGMGGTFTPTAEHVLFSRRGVLTATRRVDSTWWSWPRSVHSRKPEAFLDLVEQVSPGPYLEMFARRQRLGWDTWGNEALQHVEIGT